MAATKGFTNHLSMAACEWFLMILMFIDAALAFFLTKFAHYCQLQTPCLFCLRLDHFFGNEEPRSYLSLFCSKHRAEISSLISCDLHDKLADIREMCDDCFMSTTIQSQSNSESYGIMEGQMGIEGYPRFCLDKNFGACSCCKRQWKTRSNAQRLVQPGPVSLEASKVTVKPPVPRVAGRRRVICGDKFNRVRNNIDLDMDMDALSRVGYTELKFNSESDSEVPFSDDDNATLAVAGIGEKRGLSDDSAVIDGASSWNQDRTETNHLHTVSDPGPSLVDVHHDESITSRPGSLTSNGPIEHGSAKAVSAPSVPQEVKENGLLEVGKDMRPIQDMHSSTNMENDISNTDGIHDKNDGYESPGGSSVSEIEGESLVDKLKRQVEYDRKCLRLLQMELEEERNAADIAANEAMAMITRLQEEKAALHMEALQYLRMVEEQAEYDMEALDKANGLVDQKDKEIQDLEAELEYFRSRDDDELMMGNNMVETENLKLEHMGNGKIDENSSSDSKFMKVLDLEDEKRYILQSLSELERKFHQFSNRHTPISKPNGNVCAEKTTNQDLEVDNETQFNHSKDEKSFSRHKDSSTSNGTTYTDSSKRRLSMDHGEFDVGNLENEISDLNERLEALEADRDFLEHACNTLQTSGGFQFIQEIANHLQDLRRIRFDRTCLSVT